MNNEVQSLQKWLNTQIRETKKEIKWCETHKSPVNETHAYVLKYRLSFLETELDNLLYPIDK